jgi:hypothetical protein
VNAVLILLGVALLLAYWHAPGWLFVVGLVVAYLASAVWFPFAACLAPKCEGGRVRSSSRKTWRKCWWCGGKGSRVRWGRRLYEAVTGNRKHT